MLGTQSAFRRAALRGLGAVPAARPLSSAAKTVPLVYDLHEPPRPACDKHTSPILFMHGLFGSKKNNRSISRAISRDLGRYVYALDLRNHGESPHVPRHDYMAMADDVEAFIAEHKIKDPTLIGHSMGAKTAMTVALRSPDLVNNIIAVDNAPVDASLGSDFGKYIQAMKKVEAAGVKSLKEADKILEEVEKDVAVRQFLLGNLYRPEGQTTRKFRVPLNTIAKELNHMGDFPFKDPSVVRFEKPALFIRGTRSKYVPDEVLPLIGQFFPLFELVDIDAGHWVISENPEAFRQAVLRFLGPKE
ncbi:Alpha/beta-hydrolase [Pleurostoma richardsiae]|uniref:Alpha/beta-hydrolase n=1 Tax=Pleurostoma richardsiae TaxID=41990 RepID=A0AA38RBD4_9PEZI|nr:Alpha/beta-hydrolase [Pleurostoma richardsiae]